MTLRVRWRRLLSDASLYILLVCRTARCDFHRSIVCIHLRDSFLTTVGSCYAVLGHFYRHGVVVVGINYRLGLWGAVRKLWRRGETRIKQYGQGIATLLRGFGGGGEGKRKTIPNV